MGSPVFQPWGEGPESVPETLHPAQGGETLWRVSAGCRVSMCETLYGVFSPQTLHRVARPRLPVSLGACGNTVQCILAQTLHRVAKPRLPAPLSACGDTVQCIRVANIGQGRKALCRCSTGCRLHTCVRWRVVSKGSRAFLYSLAYGNALQLNEPYE